MKLILSQPGGPYHATIDSGAMEVELREVFLGVRLVTESGEKLSVCMRDGGFEVRYSGDGFDTGWTAFQNGTVSSGQRPTDQPKGGKK